MCCRLTLCCERREAAGTERLEGYKEPAQLGCAYLSGIRVCLGFFFLFYPILLFFVSIFPLADYNLRGLLDKNMDGWTGNRPTGSCGMVQSFREVERVMTRVMGVVLLLKSPGGLPLVLKRDGGKV